MHANTFGHIHVFTYIYMQIQTPTNTHIYACILWQCMFTHILKCWHIQTGSYIYRHLFSLLRSKHQQRKNKTSKDFHTKTCWNTNANSLPLSDYEWIYLIEKLCLAGEQSRMLCQRRPHPSQSRSDLPIPGAHSRHCRSKKQTRHQRLPDS